MNWSNGLQRLNTIFWSFFGILFVAIGAALLFSSTPSNGLIFLFLGFLCIAGHRSIRWLIQGFYS
jgi:hypothetical protein